MDTLYLELDQGLGDNIICAGLICHLAKGHKVIVRICNKQMPNKLTYETFFADTGIELVNAGWQPVTNNSPYEILQKGMAIDNAITGKVRDPFQPLYSAVAIRKAREPKEYPYPLGFFKVFNVSYQVRAANCPLRRNSFKVKQKWYPKKNRYFFKFDRDGAFPMDPDKLPAMPFVTTEYNPNESILAYREIIENAAEIHCVDSSFFHLVNSFKPKGMLFYHWYARPNSPEFNMHPEWMILR